MITAIVRYWISGEPREHVETVKLVKGRGAVSVPIDKPGLLIKESVELREDGELRSLTFLNEAETAHVQQGDQLNIAIRLAAR